MSDDHNPDKSKLELEIEANEPTESKADDTVSFSPDDSDLSGGESSMSVGPGSAADQDGIGASKVGSETAETDSAFPGASAAIDAEIVSDIEVDDGGDDFTDLDDLQDIAADEFDDSDLTEDEDDDDDDTSFGNHDDDGDDDDEDYDFYSDAPPMGAKSGGLPVKAIAIGAILLAAVGGGGYFYISKSGDKPLPQTAYGGSDTSVAMNDQSAGYDTIQDISTNNAANTGVDQLDSFGLPQPDITANNSPVEPIEAFDDTIPAFPSESNMADDSGALFEDNDVFADDPISPEQDIAQADAPLFEDDVFVADDNIPSEPPQDDFMNEDFSSDDLAMDVEKDVKPQDSMDGDVFASDDEMSVEEETTPDVLFEAPPMEKKRQERVVPERMAELHDGSASTDQPKFKVTDPINEPAEPTSYYDSSLNVPSSAMGGAVGPRMINPDDEPASRFVVVKGVTSANSLDSMIASANRALDLGRNDAALEMYQSLYAKNKRDPRILMGRAVALQKTGKANAAIQAYEELLDIDSNNPGAVVNLLGLLKEQYPSVASRKLLELKDKFPDHPAVFAQLGVTEAELGNFDSALQYLGVATTLEPSNAKHYFNMGIIAERAGKSSDALKFYQQALDVDAVYGSSKTLPRDVIYDRIAVLRRM